MNSYHLLNSNHLFFFSIFGYRIYKNKDIFHFEWNIKSIINPILFCFGGYIEYQIIQYFYPEYLFYQIINLFDEIHSIKKRKIEYKEKDI